MRKKFVLRNLHIASRDVEFRRPGKLPNHHTRRLGGGNRPGNPLSSGATYDHEKAAVAGHTTRRGLVRRLRMRPPWTLLPSWLRLVRPDRSDWRSRRRLRAGDERGLRHVCPGLRDVQLDTRLCVGIHGRGRLRRSGRRVGRTGHPRPDPAPNRSQQRAVVVRGLRPPRRTRATPLSLSRAPAELPPARPVRWRVIFGSVAAPCYNGVGASLHF